MSPGLGAGGPGQNERLPPLRAYPTHRHVAEPDRFEAQMRQGTRAHSSEPNPGTRAGVVDVKVAAEARFRRIDVMLTGHDRDERPSGVIVELTQWDETLPKPVDRSVPPGPAKA
jgi:hypothetical protein